MGCWPSSKREKWEELAAVSIHLSLNMFDIVFTSVQYYLSKERTYLIQLGHTLNSFLWWPFLNVLLLHDSTFFPWNSIWRNKVSLRASFFVWTAIIGKILTMYISRKHVIVVDWCCMCKKSSKFVDHLLFHYKIASAYRVLFLNRLG